MYVAIFNFIAFLAIAIFAAQHIGALSLAQ
jgi:hypothetical protein